MIDSAAVSRILPLCIGSRLTVPARQTFDALERDLSAHGNVTTFHEKFHESFAAAARTLGREQIVLTAEETAQLEQCGVGWPLSEALDELGRVAMLVMAASRLAPSAFHSLVHRCYEHGDPHERRGILRALPLVPDAERFLPMAVDACRSHIQPIFEAMACENPYPSVYFPELNFNQMILKALFTGTALRRVLGWETRTSPELARMANDYAQERRSAGRSIPADLARLLGHTDAVR
jgi:hypothetical protein